MGAGNDEDDNNKVDYEDNLDDEEDGVRDEPGQELGGAPPHGAEIEEEVGDEEESEEDQLHEDGLVPSGGQEPLVNLQIQNSDCFQIYVETYTNEAHKFHQFYQ